jgi:hypothetical protein
MTWSDRALEAVADLAGAVAEAPQGDGARAFAALAGVSQLVPFDCAVLGQAEGASPSAVAAVGYGRSVAGGRPRGVPARAEGAKNARFGASQHGLV